VPQEEARILREQNTWRHAERRVEMTPEERSQVREINAGQQRASRMLRVQQLLGINSTV
jgi:hypothetical protein